MSRKSLRNASRQASKRAAADQLRRSKAALSGLALGSITFGISGLLHAQNAQTQQATADSNVTPTTSASSLQEIVVTGIRGSLERSLQIKRMSLGVVDAISAEDIGQFPDSSIGEAIARIPGVTVNRGSINQMGGAGAPTATGNVTGITVRGFGTQFNEILSEGRPIASGAGQNFDYSGLGAEYVGEVDVLKTPDFSLSTGAIGATVNVKFPNPFDHPGFQARSFVSTTDYENDGGLRPAFGALVSDTFADGKFGILIDGDYTDKHILGHHIDIVGWEAEYLGCSQFAANPSGSGCGAVGTGATGNSSVPSWYPQDVAMYLERTDSRRKDGRLAFQWHPTDALLITVDDNYSSDDEHTDRWQFSTWFSNTGLSNVTQDAGGTITNFDYGPAPTDFNAFVADTYLVTNTPGINVLWDVNDDWTAELDADQSVSKLNPNKNYSDVDADVGYGPNTAVGTNGYVGGIGIGGSNSVPYWTAYGPNTNAATGPATSANFLGQNPYLIGSHVMPWGQTVNSDKINQVKLDATWHKDGTKVNFGAQFVADTWNAQNSDSLTNNDWQLWSGYGAASNNYEYYCGTPVTDPNNQCGGKNFPQYSQTNRPGNAISVLHGQSLPQSLFTPVNLSNFIPGYSNNGKLPPGLLLFSPYAVANYLEKQPINADWTPNSGYAKYAGGYPVLALNPTSVQHVVRKNYAPFITAEHNFQLGEMTLKADVGLRYQRTDVTIAGLATQLVSLGLEPGDKTAYAFNQTPATWTQVTTSYNYFLPSLDLNLMVLPSLKVRADFSRTESPPQNNLIIPNTSYGGRVGSLTSQGSNPYLLPYLSDNYDLGAEWYYASNDYLSADAFLKHVTQFPTSSSKIITIPGVIATSTLDPNYGGLAQFSFTQQVNGNSANVTGIEATWQQMLGWGFGFQLNGTYVHSNRNFSPSTYTSTQFALPGIGNSANLIAFYQAHGLQARLAVQWQGTQLLQLRQEQPTGLFGSNEPVYLDSSTELDYSMSYDITSHFSAFFEALNLSDSVYHTRGRFDNQTLNLVDYGRSFTIGVRAKM